MRSGGHEADGRLGRVALGIEHDHRATLAAEVLGDRRHEVARLALLDRARHGGVLLAQLDVDRDRSEASRSVPGPVGRTQDRGRRRRQRQRRARERHRQVVDRRQLPDRRELGRREHAPCEMTAAGCPRRAARGGRRARAARGARRFRARRVGSRRPRRAARRRSARRPRGRRDHAQVHEEQRPVLHLKAAAQLGVLDHRAIAHEQVLSALARQARLVALVQVLGERLEQRRRRASAPSARTPARRTRP